MATDLVIGLRQLAKHRPAYTLAWKMYDGTAREVFASTYIKTQLQQSAAKYRVNVARRPVTAVLNRLRISALSVPEDEAAQRTLAEIAKANELDVELPGFIEKVEVYGDAYLLQWPAEDAALTEDGTAASAVNMFVHGPESMRAIYSTENPRMIKFVIHAWDTEDDRLRVNLYYHGRIERWISREQIKQQEDGGQFALDTLDDNAFEAFSEQTEDAEGVVTGDGPIITHPWGLPIKHGRTSRPYGRPVHYDAYGPQNAVTKLVASELSTVDWLAYPWRYALSKAGTSGAQLSDWDKDNREAPKQARGGVKPSSISAKPGALNKLSNTDQVGQLEATDAKNFIDPLGFYIRVLGMITDTPMDMQTTGNVESGESRRAKLDGLIAKVESHQPMVGGAIADACEQALAMNGHADATVKVEWKPIQKVSDTEGWQAVKAKEDAGVPIKIALIEAGYLPEEIEKWYGELETKLDMLERIATVANALGGAVQMMGMEPERATELFGAFIAEVITGDDTNAE